MHQFEDFKKYKWFFTASGKLVIGGKNASQNDSLLEIIINSKKDFIVMHTARPGSPFSVIISDVKSISQKDLEECAIFTACFSQMWKSGQKYVSVHVFDSDSLYKSIKMNQGTWGIKASPKEIKVKLELVLTVQEEILRAVPEISVKSKKDILLKI